MPGLMPSVFSFLASPNLWKQGKRSGKSCSRPEESSLLFDGHVSMSSFTLSDLSCSFPDSACGWPVQPFCFCFFDDLLLREEVNDHFNIRMPSIPGASVQLTPRHGRGVSVLSHSRILLADVFY